MSNSIWAWPPMAATLPASSRHVVLFNGKWDVHLTIDDECLKASGIGPYMLSNGDVIVPVFLHALNQLATRLGASKIEITVPPSIYSTHSNVIAPILTESGFQLVYSDPHYVVEISSSIYIDQLAPDQRRDLKRGMEQYECQSSRAFLTAEEYGIIYQSRISKGYEAPAPYELLKKQFNRNPNAFVKWLCYRNSALVGCIWGIVANAETLQIGYMATSNEGKKPSANLFLIDRVYNWASQNNMKWIDLGTASIRGKTIGGLKAFKTALNAKVCLKETFEKSLSTDS